MWGGVRAIIKHTSDLLEGAGGWDGGSVPKGDNMKGPKKGTKFEDLKVDTEYTFEADGLIPPATIKQVRSFIDSHYRGDVLKKGWNFRVQQVLGGPVWMTPEGAFPKRVTRHMYKQHNIKMHPDDVRYIGNIAKQNMASRHILFDITRRITWAHGDYGDRHSCLWTEYEGALGAMMQAGIGAIRIYNPAGKGVGRAWLYPLSSRKQFILFNAYGPLQVRVIANHLSQAFGNYNYEQVRMTQDWSGYGIYLNGDGFVVHNRKISGSIRSPLMSELRGSKNSWIRKTLPKAGEGWFEKD